ncbi:hypothetical protein [Mesorhizobium sp. WSM4887]|uniref:hypothetical protein n=1 Tax=Mesorhizobium sp. WSM4887 TaxID=3038543 RepID=UPI002417FCC6|nr:hypothetical protein [Mesorhizobium sp. WSM4887]MDG4891802.1 hypothetical protein [Mesorhizobium sp. WSM4887]
MNGSDRRRGASSLRLLRLRGAPSEGAMQTGWQCAGRHTCPGALYHHFIRRDAILARMLLPGKPVAAGFRHVVTGWPSSPIGLDFSRSSHHF